MNIGFEAKRAFTNGTGLGHYSRTLISSLATGFPDNQYFLFTPRLTDRFTAAHFSNVTTVVPASFPGNVFKSAWRSNWVKADLRKHCIDLYHGLSHEIPSGIHRTGIPSVVTIHDLIFERYPRQFNPIDVQIYRYKFRYACKHADMVIAISQQTKEDIIRFYGIPEEKIRICYQSCNPSFGHTVSETEKERIKQLYQLPDQFLLYVGSIIERKNLLTICKALHQLKDQLHIPLIVIGDGGKYKQQVQQYVQQHGLQQQVRFLADDASVKDLPGFRSAADFPAIYQQALCMIYPSIFEGFGIPILEALWSKLPVITSNISCMPETGGDAAYYVDPYSVQEMANAITKVAGNAALREGMITRGVLHAQRFTQHQCAAAVMDVYQALF